MRSTMASLIFLICAISFASAADPSTPDEDKVIDAIKRMGGTAEIDTDLPKEARVAASFQSMTAIQLANLKKLDHLGALTTGNVQAVPDSGFANLAALPNLRKLTLSKSAATNSTAAKLAECKELRTLYLGGARLGDAGLLALKKLTKLEVLDVSNNAAISDAGMAHLAEMPKLEQLYLGGTAITDKGLEALRPLEGLMRLHVTNTRISSPAAEKFEREMPNLRQVRR